MNPRFPLGRPFRVQNLSVIGFPLVIRHKVRFSSLMLPHRPGHRGHDLASSLLKSARLSAVRLSLRARTCMLHCIISFYPAGDRGFRLVRVLSGCVSLFVFVIVLLCTIRRRVFEDVTQIAILRNRL